MKIMTMKRAAATAAVALTVSTSVLVAPSAWAATLFLGPASTGSTQSVNSFPAEADTFSLWLMTPSSTATITSAAVFTNRRAGTLTVEIWSDAGGSPGSRLGTLTQTNSDTQFKEFAGSFTFQSGTPYWLGMSSDGVGNGISGWNGVTTTPWGYNQTGYWYTTTNAGAAWARHTPTNVAPDLLFYPDIELSGTGVPQDTASEPSRALSFEANGGSCVPPTIHAQDSEWVATPDSCTSQGKTLLGWSTSAAFPVDKAKAQIAKGWGVIDEVIGGERMIFIPAGMCAAVTGDNTLHAIWATT